MTDPLYHQKSDEWPGWDRLELERQLDVCKRQLADLKGYRGKLEEVTEDAVIKLRVHIASMERELIAAKRIIELAYDHRFEIHGMLQAINNYEDALKP